MSSLAYVNLINVKLTV